MPAPSLASSCRSPRLQLCPGCCSGEKSHRGLLLQIHQKPEGRINPLPGWWESVCRNRLPAAHCQQPSASMKYPPVPQHPWSRKCPKTRLATKPSWESKATRMSLAGRGHGTTAHCPAGMGCRDQHCDGEQGQGSAGGPQRHLNPSPTSSPLRPGPDQMLGSRHTHVCTHEALCLHKQIWVGRAWEELLRHLGAANLLQMCLSHIPQVLPVPGPAGKENPSRLGFYCPLQSPSS